MEDYFCSLTEAVDVLRNVLVDRNLRDDKVVSRNSYTWKEYAEKEGEVSEGCYRSKSSWTAAELKRLELLNMSLLDISLLDAEKIERFLPNPNFTQQSPPMDALVRSVTPRDDVLYHLTPFHPQRCGEYIGRLDHLMKKNRTVGNPNIDTISFLKDRQTDLLYGVWYPDDSWSGFSNDNYPIRFEISVPELVKYRSIFHDSMGLTTQESDHNYVVFGGIPIQTIRAIEALDTESGELVKRVEI